ncbi:M28 family metallopeptidase [Flavobacteriaceae sp. LMIT009]
MQRAIFIFLILLNSCAQNDKNSSNDHLKTLNEEITGDLAFETTAFVEQYWRVVGNTGFNKSIYWVADHLEKAGYVNEDKATEDDILTYRIEKRPLKRPTWESVDATVTVVGEETSLLSHDTNRNMIALNSFSTSEEGVTAEVVHVNDVKELESYEVKGKIVFAETHPSRIFKQVVLEKGALGIITYNNPSYLQPEKNKTSIQFRSIPLDTISKSWGIALSYEAKEKLKTSLSKGKTELNVKVKTKIYPSEELTIVADIRGSELPEERLVFSAHVQEPGANDNASGVGAALEMATVTAKLFNEGRFIPKRTLTYLWGDEIISTRRYVQDDSIRAKNIKWGISLDMVGEDTEKTGGSFLIEKMPDPSAIWTRGNDKHTEWGGRPLKKEDMTPHYLNDFVIKKFKEQGELANWEVNTNPYEGGSDHVPFLRRNIPSVLFWHFTDQFYHTDNDRIDKVSKSTLKNVSVGSLAIAFELLNSDKTSAISILKDIEQAAITRLDEELYQSKLAIKNGETLESQIDIIKTWEEWYLKTSNSVIDMLEDEASLKNDIKQTQDKISNLVDEILKKLKA